MQAQIRAPQPIDMPDGTWDLAWMTAAFAVLPGQTFGELAERCASKLMDGQIAAGECTGMWGPVCVNPAVLSPVCKVVIGLADEKAKMDATVKPELQASMKGGKGSRKISKAEEEQIRLEQALVQLQRESARVSQVGLRLFGAMAGAISLEAANGAQTRIQGHPYLIHNQALADMDSTAVSDRRRCLRDARNAVGVTRRADTSPEPPNGRCRRRGSR